MHCFVQTRRRKGIYVTFIKEFEFLYNHIYDFIYKLYTTLIYILFIEILS